MDRPITLSEYSSWLQMVCAEAAICLRASDQLTARIEKIATFKETLAHRLHGTKQRVDQLKQTINELEKTTQPVRECLTATQAKLAKLDEESALLQQQLAENKTQIEQVEAKAEGPDKELVQHLKAEEAKLTSIKRSLAESVTTDNVWDTLPLVMSELKFKSVLVSRFSDTFGCGRVVRSSLQT
ncbi:hypothetical protein quinque_012695 [Culex quinquefasciatus]